MHPDRIGDDKLQRLILRQIAEEGRVQFSDFSPGFFTHIRVSKSETPKEYWRARVLIMLDQMYGKSWIGLTNGHELNSSVWALRADDVLDFTFWITNEGRFHLEGGRASKGDKEQTNKQVQGGEQQLLIGKLIDKFHYPNPRREDTGRERIAKAIAWRRGQHEFRQRLLDTYGRCLVTGCDAEDALEAAHIRPFNQGGTFDLSNGLLLRADIHTLFDLGLIAVDSTSMFLILSSTLKVPAHMVIFPERRCNSQQEQKTYHRE